MGNPFQPPFYNTYPMKRRFNQITAWFNNLPSVGKVIVVIVGGSLGLSLLKSVFQLITSLISLALLGIILYVVYKFFITPKSPQ
ncbi:hypothetical protein [Coleofasciculus sp. G3-WIS-01]|uniref:hypothetical protein n=1 Tax=unclassified Coleofasciculus TaxID=2692782 RepID=UPI004062A4E0